MSDGSINGGPNREAREEHEHFIHKLSKMMPGSACSLESILYRADAAYLLVHNAGLFRDEQDILNGNQDKVVPPVLPSAQRELLYREEVQKDRPPLIARHFMDTSSTVRPVQEYDISYVDMLDPKVALAKFDGPIAIRESIDDNGPITGSSSLNWLGCSSFEEATDYCERVGRYHEQPRSVEGNGVYTYREIYDNPYYLERVNAGLGEIDHEQVQAAIREALARVGLSPEDPVIETTISTIVLNVVQSNNTAKQQLLSSGDKLKVRGYLNPRVRSNALIVGKYAIDENINQRVNYFRDTRNVDSDLPVNLSAKDLRFIDITASSLVESLQVPYELRAPTHGLIAGILQGLSSIARIKKHSTQSFMQSDMEKKALESSALVDNNVTDLGVEINRRYSSIMVSYAKVDHAHS